MNPEPLITNGFAPWSPCEDDVDLDVWHEYEVPLAGTFQCGEDLVLFTSVGETHGATKFSTWAYTVLECDVPDSFKSHDAMSEWILARFERTESAYAFAVDMKVTECSRAGTWESLYAGASPFISSVVDKLERKLTDRSKVSVRQAEVEAIERQGDLLNA